MPRLGLNAACYYKPGGVSASGSWLPLTNLKDLTLNLETGEADVTTRAALGWRAYVSTLKEASIEAEAVWDTGDDGFNAIKAAFFGNAIIGLLVLDGPMTDEGHEGLQADCNVTSFTRSEPLEEALTVSWTMKPTYSANPPAWVRIGTGGVITPT